MAGFFNGSGSSVRHNNGIITA